MPAAVVIGAQWGDEGKGKIVDLLSPHAELVVRYAGGANAGHTLVVEGRKLVLHLVPSGILHPKTRCLIGQGTVVDPGTLIEEIEALEERNLAPEGRLVVSDRAHVVLPYHKALDAMREQKDDRIGTTKRGIGPTYEDKVGRRGVRIGDLVRDGLREKVARALEAWAPTSEALGGELPSADEVTEQARAWGQRLAPFIGDTGREVATAIRADRSVLLEGAQGTMLDIDHGTYPFVTSSNAVSGGACTGAGVGPTAISRVIGISKAYATRVGEGPFPTELADETGEAIRKAGAEFGATTGRPRRCGWLDIPALRLAVRVNGLTGIALTKLDVLRGLPELSICVAYELDGERFDEPPFDAYGDVTPIYETFPGFDEDITGCRSREALPANARHYVERIEALVNCPAQIISVGPDREQTFGETNPFS